MIIFPAIDIKDGLCVRLIKGDFRQITSYENTPIDQATKYFQNGFNHIHIVDIDGALHGRPVNSILIKEIIKNVKSKIQIGGGIRTIEDINRWIEIGIDKVVMGTAAVENIELLKTATNLLKIPVIASGGIGTKEHFFEGVYKGGASALLAASVFHFNKYSINEVKEFLMEKDIKVRL